jgi:hypothetical protein
MPRLPAGSSRRYLGVDPGASGGLASIYLPEGNGFFVTKLAIVKAVPMPQGDLEKLEWFEGFHPGITFCCIEKVSGFIGSPQPGSAMFKFGCGYGKLLMALLAAKIPHEEVVPRTWQSKLGIAPRKRSESKTQFKNRLKSKAQQLFPNVKVTLATADALLIAEYCRRKCEGRL